MTSLAQVFERHSPCKKCCYGENLWRFYPCPQLLRELTAALPPSPMPDREALEKILCDFFDGGHPNHCICWQCRNPAVLTEKLMAWAVGKPQPCANCTQWKPGAAIKVCSFLPLICADCGTDLQKRHPRPEA